MDQLQHNHWAQLSAFPINNGVNEYIQKYEKEVTSLTKHQMNMLKINSKKTLDID